MSRPLRVLFVSGELIAGDLAWRLKEDGCEVRLFIGDESRSDCFDGMVDKTADWKQELDWVGRDGLIIFDDVGYGADQDDLRRQGFRVVGGSTGGDRLEQDREFCQQLLAELGMHCPVTRDFEDFDHAIAFVRQNPRRWVIKQDGHTSTLNYVGQLDDGRDVIDVLENYRDRLPRVMSTVSLQEFVDGIEIAVARYFNGRTWIGPIEINVEHKSLCDGDLGPKTGEMGTLMWYEADGRSPLFDQTLARLAPHLRQADFHGDIDINFIVNDQGAFPIEITARFGSPAVHLQTALHRTPWSVFLQSVADGVECDFDYRQGYGVVVSVVIPPFPYRTIERNRYLKGVEIAFRQPPTPDELRRLHYEEVSRRSDEPDRLRVAGSNGYLLYVTGVGSTIASARESTYALVKKLVIPKMFYRTDIAIRFETVGRPLLERWGWILPVLPEG